MYSMAILCGGYGTRLGALTATTPKCLVDVNGRVFLDHVLRLVASQGVERVVLCVGHLGHMVETLIRDGWLYGLKIEYSYDGPRQLGTAGALRNAAHLLGEDFFVLHGDSYLPYDYAAIQAAYQRTDDPAMMVVCEPPEGYKPNVWFEHGTIYDHDKRFRHAEMQHIDYGLGVLNRDAFLRLGYDVDDLSDYYARLARLDELAGYDVSPERFYTIGTPASLAFTRGYLGARVASR